MKEVLETIELDEVKDSLVGIPGVSGLSTEQRKRLTIAVELVANPSIIFMDEPTTGLDARSAAIVMRAVKNVADTGRTIVCTIHQPSIDIFEAFDEVVDQTIILENLYYTSKSGYFIIKYVKSIAVLICWTYENSRSFSWEITFHPCMGHSFQRLLKLLFLLVKF